MERPHAGGADVQSAMNEVDWMALARLPEEDREAAVCRALRARALPEAKRVAAEITELLEVPIFAIGAHRVVDHLARAASPARAVMAFGEAVRALEERRGDASPLFVDPILGQVIEIAGASGRAARLMASDPALAIELSSGLAPERMKGISAHADVFRRIVEAAGNDTVRFDRLIRRYRNRQMLRIALRELREADVRQTAAELADLASAALQAALDHHLPMVEAEIGQPDPACGHVVIGMGKLGGRELNFSSDIDLIYLYEHDDGRAGEATIHELFVELFRRVTASISRITEHGFVFRVDLDLRPEGRPGPLANSLASAERYYETWGRTWERAAWIKARPVAGDQDLGPRIAEFIRPFVYRRAFDLAAIEEIVQMKSKIDLAEKRSRLGHRLDLKLGKGGIREIEFFVQALQLLHGGRDRRLRVPNTLEALGALEAAGLVSARVREALADAYLLLRRVEHRIQIVEEQQTHLLPSDPEALAQLARSLDYASAAALKDGLGRSMAVVHEHFANLLGSVEEEDAAPPEVDVLLDPEAEEEAREILVRLGAKHPYADIAALRSAARHPASPFHPRADSRRRNVARAFLAECLVSPSVDRALKHLPELTRTFTVHRSYLETLVRPPVRRGVARVLGASNLLARILVSNPTLLSHVLLPDSLPSQASLQIAVNSQLLGVGQDMEEALALLRSEKQEEVLRTAMADLAGEIDVVQVGERLSRLAEVIIEATLGLAWSEMEARYGPPLDDGAELAVIGGGTLGARELGYRTDVDLSFVFRGEGETAGGSRDPISVRELYTRVAQRLLSFLSMRGREGDLYPVDMRLRPSGSQGALVVSLRNFEAYHQRDAQLWERQALIRSRTIAGASQLRARVDAAIHAAAFERGPVPDAASRIAQMRERMHQERSLKRLRRGAEPLDLKLGRGGLVEIEFLVQYLMIQHGRDVPEIRTTSTRAGLAALGHVGLLERDVARRLIEAYDRMRRLMNWLRVAHDEMLDVVDLSEDALRPLALAIGYQGNAAAVLLRRDLEADTGAVHQAYLDVLGGDPRVEDGPDRRG